MGDVDTSIEQYVLQLLACRMTQRDAGNRVGTRIDVSWASRTARNSKPSPILQMECRGGERRCGSKLNTSLATDFLFLFILFFI